jgi:hypothetical protein
MISSKKVPGLVGAALLAIGMGCSGEIGPGKGPGGSSNEPGETGNDPGKGGTKGGSGGGTVTPPVMEPDGTINSAGPYALRRLTVLEYSNTIRDLLGVNLADTDRRGFSADQVVHGGFASGAALVTSVDSRQFLDVSVKVAEAATKDMAKLMPAGCATPAAGAEEACIPKFLEQFGLRAFRRPVTAAETGTFVGLYKQLRTDPAVTYTDAVQDVVLAILQSPEFLYRWELDGQPIVESNGLIKFGPYEVASRLSYFLWATMPDEALFMAAKSGALSTPEQIGAQAQRMLKEDKAADGLRDFHMQWLALYGVDELEKDSIFTTYSPEVAKAMLAESSAFIDSVLRGPQATGKLEALFTSSTSFINEDLAKHYGVTGVTGADLKKTDLNPAQRAGILTQGAYLARHSKENDSFPIARGVHVLRQILCQDIPEPMLTLPPAPEQKQGVTTRKMYTDHTAAVACQACHAAINGVGFAFENYDATGAYREKEEGQTVDASGALELPSGKITYKNAIDFVQAIAKTPEARECLARNWMRALLRRDESNLESGSLKAITNAFASSNYDMRELVIALTKTRAFTHRNPTAARQ